MIVGYKLNGERLLFEYWVYRYYIWDLLKDEFLTYILDSCSHFEDYWSAQMKGIT